MSSQSQFNILIVDDEANIRNGLAHALNMEDYHTVEAEHGHHALTILKNQSIDLVITDLRMPVMKGSDLLEEVRNTWPTIPVIILTGYGTVEGAVEAMRHGAHDFLTKPVNLEHLFFVVMRALSNRQMVLDYRRLQQELETYRSTPHTQLIVRSKAMNKVMQMVEQVAATRATVLITGESGVGKELIARAIHNLSPRRDKPFIAVHCAALSNTLIESELFGHEKGAFTGAVSRRLGRFDLAHTGTIFLDEVGEIDLTMQVKLLRVLQERKFERVGGESTIEVDTRVISATNKNLDKMIQNGEFRDDLFYRLNVLSIDIPPLRERKEDISLLIASFIKEFAQENGKNVDGIDSQAMAEIYNYSWPGNIRELRNCIESAVALCRRPMIGIEDLPSHIFGKKSGGTHIHLPLGITLEEAERQIIQETMIHNRGNKSITADMLGIGRKTLYTKIIRYNLEKLS